MSSRQHASAGGSHHPESRAIALIGHSHAGKTALGEALLFLSGATTRIGKTVDGTSHFDFEPEEVKRGCSLSTAVYSTQAHDGSFTLLDTPGSSSFIFDTVTALRAADAALLVASGAVGVKTQGEKAWRAACEEGLPRAVFVNELDRERASLESAVEHIRRACDVHPVPITIPVGTESQFAGVIDVLGQCYLHGDSAEPVELTPEQEDIAASARRNLLEAVAETDESLLERYVSGEELSDDEVRDAFCRAFARGDIVPLFCGAAQTRVGLRALLNCINRYFPAAASRAYRTTEAENATVNCDPDGPFAGIIFKTFADPFMGQVSLVRVVSGRLRSDQSVLNSTTGAHERVGKLHIQLGKEQRAVDEAVAGEIVAIAKLKETHTGDTLCLDTHPVQLVGFSIPEGAVSYAAEPRSRADEDKLFAAVARLTAEDPAIHVHRDPATNETLISGLGQDHVEITLERVKRKFNVDMILHAPKVPYRETITRRAEGQGKHKKQSGGRGQYGDCWLRLSPLPRGEGFVFENEVFGGAIPKNYIPAVQKGVEEAMEHGPLGGFPMVDIRCVVYDGSYHAVDSSDMAFKIAASKGFKSVVEKAGAVLLEPIMLADIVVPDDTTGAVMGDLNSRRAKVLQIDAEGHSQLIRAEAPLAEMLTYAQTLRALTADRGSFHLELRGYDEVPAHVAQRVLSEREAAPVAANT